MKTKNDTLNAIQTMVDNAVSNAGYDKTRNAVVLSRNTNNTYKIKMDGIEYNNVICYGCGIFQTNEVAKVIIPNGQPSQMFLLAVNPHPIGTIYQTSNVNFDPNVEWGGVWVKIEGKVLVGLDANDTYFDTVGETGGNKGMYAHTHGSRELIGNVWNVACQSQAQGITSNGIVTRVYASGAVHCGSSNSGPNDSFTIDATHEHDSVGDDNNNDANIANMPPYEVVIIWKRTA